LHRLPRSQLGSPREFVGDGNAKEPGIFLHTCPFIKTFEKVNEIECMAVVHPVDAGKAMLAGDLELDSQYCLRCNRELEAGEKSVAVFLFAQTTGIRPRQKSSARRICFCPQCAVSLAMGPAPEGALNLAAWEMIRDLVGAQPNLTEAAWENLHGTAEALLPATGTEGVPAPSRPTAYLEF
jgi:hypothetical protein